MKKFLTLTLALALAAASMSIAVFAADPPVTDKDGDATIEFKVGGAEIIPDPDPDPDKGNFDVTGLDFGEHDLAEIGEDDQTYDSREEGRNGKTSTGAMIKNGLKGGWSLTVEMSEFEAAGTPTMLGYELALDRTGMGTYTNAPNRLPSYAPMTVSEIAAGTANAKELIAAADNGSEGVGIFGYEWGGIIDIPGGSMGDEASEPLAVMKWTVVNA